MDAQIEGYLLQLKSVDQDLPGLATQLSPDEFNWQPAPGHWSIGQCIEHLNITTERYLPVLRQAMADARAQGWLKPGPFVLGFIERWFVGEMEPPIRHRMKTRAGFVPVTTLDPAITVERFKLLNEQLAACFREAEGLDLGKIKVRSQFGPVRWSLNATFLLLLAHERRHVRQARNVRHALEQQRDAKRPGPEAAR